MNLLVFWDNMLCGKRLGVLCLAEAGWSSSQSGEIVGELS